MQPTRRKDVETCGFRRDAEKLLVHPTTSVVAPRWYVGFVAVALSLVLPVSTRAEIAISTDAVVKFPTTPFVFTTTAGRSYLRKCVYVPPTSGTTIGGGVGGISPVCKSPCEPIDSGVGLGSKPCVAMSREVKIILSASYGGRCRAVSGDALADRSCRSAGRCDRERAAAL